MNVRVGTLSGLGAGGTKRRRNGYGTATPKITVKSRIVKSRSNRNRNARDGSRLTLPGFHIGGVGRLSVAAQYISTRKL